MWFKKDLIDNVTPGTDEYGRDERLGISGWISDILLVFILSAISPLLLLIVRKMFGMRTLSQKLKLLKQRRMQNMSKLG